MTALQSFTRRLVEYRASQIHQRLTERLNAILGEGWTPADIAPRMHRMLFRDGSEVFKLDGQTILTVQPFHLGA